MRIAFMGTPDFAVPTLDALIEAGHEVVAVYTQPPRRAGRGKALSPSPVQRRAEAAGIEVRTPTSLRGVDAQAAFAALDLDAAVVAAYGQILPAPVLVAPRHGCLNVHASLLPRWRGAAPVQRAILAGDTHTGVSIMAMEKGLDTGPVFARRRTWIGCRTAGELSAALAEIGAELMVEVLAKIDVMTPVPQPAEGATYAAKIEKGEARLDFTRSAAELERQVRAFNPAPGAFFELAGERVRVLQASAIRRWDRIHQIPGEFVDLMDAQCDSRNGAVIPANLKRGEIFVISCGEGYLEPLTVQRAGRQAMPAWEAYLGMRIEPGTILS